MTKSHINTLLRAKCIQDLARQYYEQGNYSKCYYQVWRVHIYPIYPMGYRTFLKYMKMDLTPLNGSVKVK